MRCATIEPPALSKGPSSRPTIENDSLAKAARLSLVQNVRALNSSADGSGR